MFPTDRCTVLNNKNNLHENTPTPNNMFPTDLCTVLNNKNNLHEHTPTPNKTQYNNCQATYAT